jgi:hypothetical protein
MMQLVKVIETEAGALLVCPFAILPMVEWGIGEAMPECPNARLPVGWREWGVVPCP